MFQISRELLAYERFLGEVSERIHMDSINDSINFIHRQIVDLRQRAGEFSSPPGNRNMPALTDLTQLERRILDECEAVNGVLSKELPTVSLVYSGAEAHVEAMGGKRELWSKTPNYILVTVANATDLEQVLNVDPVPAWDVVFLGRNFRIEPRGVERILLKVVAEEAGSVAVTLVVYSSRAEHRLEPLHLTFLQSGRLAARILDYQTHELVPARVYLKASDGRYYVPCEAERERPSHFDYAYSFFYADGVLALDLPAGPAEITVQRGFEYEQMRAFVDIPSGAEVKKQFELKRWIDMAAQGWYSCDTHLQYVTYEWHANGDYDELDMKKRAEDINVGHVLALKHWWAHVNLVAVRPNRYPPGPIPRYCRGKYMTVTGEECRNNEVYGHMVFWGLKEFVEPMSTGWMGGPDFPDHPENSAFCDRVHEQGGYVSAAHDIWQEEPVLAALGKLDLVDCHHPDRWYHLLNCGFRLPIAIGSDYPANLMGFARTYVYVGGGLDYERFIQGLMKGRTFVSSGAMIFLEVEGKGPGDTLDTRARSSVAVRARAMARVPLMCLEIVANGEVVQRLRGDGQEMALSLETELPVVHSGWVAARCSPNEQMHWWPNPHVAHTSPVYLDNGTAWASCQSALEMLAAVNRGIEVVKSRARFETAAQREEVLAVYESARAIYEKILARAQ